MNFGIRVTAALLLSVAAMASAADVADSTFLRVSDAQTGFLTSLRCAEDANRVEFIRNGQALGAITLRLRSPGAPWREVSRTTNWVELSSTFHPGGDVLHWEIAVKNTGGESFEIGDLALPLPMSTDYVWDHEETFVRRVFRHALSPGTARFSTGCQ